MSRLQIDKGELSIGGHKFTIPTNISLVQGDIVHVSATSEERCDLFLEFISGLARFSNYTSPADGTKVRRESIPIQGLENVCYQFSEHESFCLSDDTNDLQVKLPFNVYRAQKIGFVFGEPKQYVIGDTVREEIRFSFAAVRKPFDNDLLGFKKYGLHKIRENPTVSLSGGESHRLNIGCVFETDTPVIIMDLSAANLDVDFKRRMNSILLDQFQSEKIVIIYDGERYDFLKICTKAIKIENREVTVENIEDTKSKVSSRQKIKLLGGPSTERNVLEILGFEVRHRTEIFSLKLREFQRLLFSSPNGTGKTTLTRWLVGLQSGTEGRPLFPNGSKEIAATFQYPDSLPANSSVGEIDIGGLFRECYPHIPKDYKVMLLDLSKRKLLYVLCIISLPVDILILDEPFACLDHEDMKFLAERINQTTGKSFLIFNHEGIIACENQEKIG